MGQIELVSAHVELVAVADVEMRVGGESIALAAGATWSSSVSAETDIEVPGLLTARLVPGTPASQTQAKLDAAQEVLAAALNEAGVDDVAAARVLDERRQRAADDPGSADCHQVEALSGDEIGRPAAGPVGRADGT